MKQLSILVLFLCVLTYACESSSDENTPNGYMDVNDDHYVIKGITITGINLDEESTTYTYDMRIHFDETIPGENWNKLLIDLYSPDSISPLGTYSTYNAFANIGRENIKWEASAYTTYLANGALIISGFQEILPEDAPYGLNNKAEIIIEFENDSVQLNYNGNCTFYK